MGDWFVPLFRNDVSKKVDSLIITSVKATLCATDPVRGTTSKQTFAEGSDATFYTLYTDTALFLHVIRFDVTNLYTALCVNAQTSTDSKRNLSTDTKICIH